MASSNYTNKSTEASRDHDYHRKACNTTSSDLIATQPVPSPASRHMPRQAPGGTASPQVLTQPAPQDRRSDDKARPPYTDHEESNGLTMRKRKLHDIGDPHPVATSPPRKHCVLSPPISGVRFVEQKARGARVGGAETLENQAGSWEREVVPARSQAGSATPSTSRSTLLGIAPEIRNLIYERLCDVTYGSNRALSILQTCRQIREEAMKLIQTHSMARFYFSFALPPYHTPLTAKLLDVLPIEVYQRTQRILITYCDLSKACLWSVTQWVWMHYKSRGLHQRITREQPQEPGKEKNFGFELLKYNLRGSEQKLVKDERTMRLAHHFVQAMAMMGLKHSEEKAKGLYVGVVDNFSGFDLCHRLVFGILSGQEWKRGTLADFRDAFVELFLRKGFGEGGFEAEVEWDVHQYSC